MKEILPAVLRYGFDVWQLHRIEAFVETGNMASRQLLSWAGFMLEGVQQQCEWKQGRFIDLAFYALLQKSA